MRASRPVPTSPMRRPPRTGPRRRTPRPRHKKPSGEMVFRLAQRHLATDREPDTMWCMRRFVPVTVLSFAVTIAGLAVATPAQAATYVPPAARQRVDLNASWRFMRSDVAGAQAPGFNAAAWSAVTVPHTWNAQDGQDGGDNYYRGVGWYRRHYTPPAGFAGRKLWLQFAGANTVTDVWVNGTYLGQHRGGYARFRFDATAALHPGADNVIAVKVNNARNADIAPLDADFTFFGGLYRNVSLVVTDPYLYKANVEISDADTGTVTDVVTEPLGLRSFAVDPAQGFFLNGSHLALHGVNRHQDRLNRGTAISDAEHTQDFDLMTEMGVN